jgi:hypothetical protein
MQITRRGLLIAGAALALFSCTRPRKKDDDAKEVEEVKEEATETEEEPQPEQIVDELTYYDVFRVDVREGILGDTVAHTLNTVDFSDSYAMLSPDGTFNFEIKGVVYNGKISLGRQTKHLYSGQDTEVTQLLFDGKDDTTVGSVLISGYYYANLQHILIEMVTDVDGKMTFMTYYLWEHVDYDEESEE